MTKLTAYLAPRDLTDVVKDELKNIEFVNDRLILTKGKPQKSYWAQNIWHEATLLDVTSVGDAVKKLRAIQKNWCLYSTNFHRRAKLIEEGLPKVKMDPIAFPNLPKREPLGSWTLLEQNKILFSTKCSSPFANGEPLFLEDKLNPPSRAYLKLWEVFSILQQFPESYDVCLDLGASPGGWTWVLANFGANVISLDRSPLHPSLGRREKVEFRQGSAFSVKPEDFPEVSWLFSDVICYPDKLFEYLEKWLATEYPPNMICTLKFQGKEHYHVIDKFAAIANSQIFHLANNKHELTWVRLRQ